MARRRNDAGNDAGFEEYVEEDPSFGGFDPGNFRGVEAPLIGGPDEAQFGPGATDGGLSYRIGQDAALGAFDDPIAGNTDNPRSLNPQNPNTITTSRSPQPAFGLPQGVSVNESMGGYEDGSRDTPAMPFSPSPAAGQRPNPSIVPTPGPTRRSAAPSALFGQESGSTMFGRAGGLLGGGQGVLGAGDDGEIDPTLMMKKLLEQYQRG